MSVLVLILQGLVSLAMLAAGAAKLSGKLVDEFVRFRYPDGFRVFIGAYEIAAGTLLLLGFWAPDLAAAGAALVVAGMAGAAFTHLVRVRDPFGRAIPPLILLAFAAVVLAARWPL